MSHPLQCSCGLLKGSVALTGTNNRCVCYCRDCQAFAHFLGRPAEILDQHGGSDIVQMAPKRVSFTAGKEHLACMRLGDKGLLRWYAKCCNTPVGNTLPNHKQAFVGLVHSCLGGSSHAVDRSFGPVTARFNTKSAHGATMKMQGAFSTLIRIGSIILGARIDGSYRHTPFFVEETGSPVVIPTVLSRQQRQNLEDAARA